MTRIERIVLTVLCGIVLASLLLLLRTFYLDATMEVPRAGGTYIEGSVGEVHPLNPWFTVTNDVNRDIVSLVFSGLMTYDPKTKEIVEDLATLTVSSDNRIYTAKLKEDLYWHDSTEENPHLVTADDIVFTYQTIQNPEFPNTLLKQNFRGVEVEKIDDRTVQFRLEKPYAFFTSNLTLGLLPAKHFEDIPVANFDQTLGFGFNPIGSGPYKFISLLQTDLSTEVTLQRFERHPYSQSKLERIVFRVFPDYSTLLSDLANLDGVRLVPRNDEGVPILPKGFRAIPYTLPQYVALFFNLDRPLLQDEQLRLGLQLATNKQELIDEIKESLIIDTPLLEIDLGDWRYQFDPIAAQGAFVDSDWNLPEKARLQELQERREANATGNLQFIDQIVYLDTGAILTLTGSLADISLPAFVNGTEVQTGSALNGTTMSGTWLVKLTTNSVQTGALRIGINRVRVTDGKSKTLDTAYIERFIDRKKFRLAREEQRILQKYTDAKNEETPESERVTIADLYVEEGILRMRQEDDPPSVRVNEAREELKITLLTSKAPETYRIIASKLVDQWRERGVDIQIQIPETRKEFEEQMLSRNYDVLLFGQSLLDNLDSYPYWHSSQMQDISGDRNKLKLDAFNLSQYASFEADALLTNIRETRNADLRSDDLEDLNELLKKDTPAIFLYSPLYVFGFREELGGIDIGALSLHSDRFLTLEQWFIQTERQFKGGKSWLSFFTWLPSLL